MAIVPNLYHSTVRGQNPPPFAPAPGVEGVVGFSATALGNALLVYLAGGEPVPVIVATPDLEWLRSDKDTDFTAAAGVGSMLTANLPGLSANSGRIESVTVLADQRLRWEIALFSTDGFTNADLDVDSYLASVRFATGDGQQIDAVGAYRYDAYGLALPYRDADATGELHVGLVNRGPSAKNAGATGEVVVLFSFRADD